MRLDNIQMSVANRQGPAVRAIPSVNNKITARDVNVYYATKRALKDINLDIEENRVTALIGPSGCGKSTLLGVLLGLVAPSQGGIGSVPRSSRSTVMPAAVAASAAARARVWVLLSRRSAVQTMRQAVTRGKG